MVVTILSKGILVYCPVVENDDLGARKIYEQVD